MTRACPVISEARTQNFAQENTSNGFRPNEKSGKEDPSTVLSFDAITDEMSSSQQSAKPLHADIVIEGLSESRVLLHPPSPVLSVDNDSSSFSPASSITPSCECDQISNKCLCFDDLSLDGSPLGTNLPAPPDADPQHSSFMALRCTYLLVTLVIMLADGLQGLSLIHI